MKNPKKHRKLSLKKIKVAALSPKATANGNTNPCITQTEFPTCRACD